MAMQGVGLVKKGAPVDDELVMTGEELANGGEEIKEKIHKAILFARTTPEQKLAIVEALQKSGEVVGMMGDGVNDAPALKKADIGITVFESSDVAREAADVVLLDNNFKTIIQALIGGREMMLNIRRVMIFLLSGTFSTLFFTLGTIVLGLSFPLTTTIILLINFGVETIPSVIISLWPGKVAEKRITRPTKGELLGFSSWLLILFFGLIIGTLGVGFYYLNLPLSVLIAWLMAAPILLSLVLRGGVFDNVIK
jgi:magnesium-transporting ATPase (P-type)